MKETTQPAVYRVKDVAQLMAVSSATVWRWTRGGDFPKPFKLGKEVTVWDAEEVRKFIKRMKEAK